jgi:hypothetical protein
MRFGAFYHGSHALNRPRLVQQADALR